MPPDTAAVPFSDLGLSDAVVRAVKGIGYESASPIQAATIPAMLEGADILGQAQTGTGKTAAFALPILHRLRDRRPTPKRACRALVLSPTRELASQIAESFRTYGRHLGLRVATVFGGMAGPLYVVYLRSSALDMARFRATMTFALVCLSSLRAVGYGGLGFYDARVLWLLAAALPVLVVAMIAVDRWHAMLDEARFGHVVAALLVVSGGALMFK